MSEFNAVVLPEAVVVGEPAIFARENTVSAPVWAAFVLRGTIVSSSTPQVLAPPSLSIVESISAKPKVLAPTGIHT